MCRVDGEEAAALLLPVTQEYFSMPYLSKQHGGKWLGEGDLAQKLRELAQQVRGFRLKMSRIVANCREF